jgi:integrase/recombinase XerD
MPRIKKKVGFSNEGSERLVTLAQAFEEFCEDKAANNLAPKTIANYRQSYEYFVASEFDDCDDDFDIKELFKVHIEQWKLSMVDSEMRISTINHYLRDVRAFLYWCMDDDRKSIEPALKIALVKGQESLPKIYTDKEVEVLLQKPINQKDWIEWRTWAIVNWVVGTGNRASTVCNIKIGDLDFQHKEVALRHTKSKEAQKIPMSSGVISVMNEYIKKCRKGCKHNDWLFPSYGNEQLSYEGLAQAFRRYCIERGVGRTSIHGLRHYFATDWIRSGGRGDNLQKLLGHSTYDMTQNYIKLVNKDLKENLDEFNPLDKFRKGSSRTKKVNISD